MPRRVKQFITDKWNKISRLKNIFQNNTHFFVLNFIIRVENVWQLITIFSIYLRKIMFIYYPFFMAYFISNVAHAQMNISKRALIPAFLTKCPANSDGRKIGGSPLKTRPIWFPAHCRNPQFHKSVSDYVKKN